MKKLLGALLVGACVVLFVAGCGGGLSAGSSCKDFSEASFEEQHEVIGSLSSKSGTPAYTSPLGEPEVGYYCAGNPETTLEQFFEQASQSGEGG